MGKTIGGSILILTASVLVIGHYLIASILANGQLSSTRNMASILNYNMAEYIPYPFYFSIACVIAGIGLLGWGIVEGKTAA
ncbi:hypothetical protein [Alteribacter keqinensis]|uniref:Uncharacterized protein n=1 Tax=Alteribacter keqinensis TaxID=2483800 RepID=A0A3M7TRA3_9BACI|nr:hypothetical protein [Alteribacter keqinensis]RNA66890.1 hypothetical protein EBO34_16945 [Alteribacter keqinensis]